jgi:phage gp37-like protein
MSERDINVLEHGGSLEGVQVGDTIVVLTETGSVRRPIVTSAGKVWVTALGTRFRRDTGQAASKYDRPCAMTVAENDRREEIRRVLATLRVWGLRRDTVAVHELTPDQLRKVAALLDTFENGLYLPAHLRDHAFGRSGCKQVEGEGALVARARGSAAECAEDAAMLLREGKIEEAGHLLDSAHGYLDHYRFSTGKS